MAPKAMNTSNMKKLSVSLSGAPPRACILPVMAFPSCPYDAIFFPHDSPRCPGFRPLAGEGTVKDGCQRADTFELTHCRAFRQSVPASVCSTHRPRSSDRWPVEGEASICSGTARLRSRMARGVSFRVFVGCRAHNRRGVGLPGSRSLTVGQCHRVPPGEACEGRAWAPEQLAQDT